MSANPPSEPKLASGETMMSMLSQDATDSDCRAGGGAKPSKVPPEFCLGGASWSAAAGPPFAGIHACVRPTPKVAPNCVQRRSLCWHWQREEDAA